MHHFVLYDDLQVQLTGHTFESASSASYSSYFDNIIEGNPQDTNFGLTSSPAKIPKLSMSYKQATSSNVISTSDITSISTIQDTDLDMLLAQMQAKFGDITPTSRNVPATRSSHHIGAQP